MEKKYISVWVSTFVAFGTSVKSWIYRIITQDFLKRPKIKVFDGLKKAFTYILRINYILHEEAFILSRSYNRSLKSMRPLHKLREPRGLVLQYSLS